MVENTKRKKWSKSRSKEKTNNMVLIDKDIYERILKEIIKNKVSTPTVLIERFHITHSLAKKIFNELVNLNMVLEYTRSSKQSIYLKKD